LQHKPQWLDKIVAGMALTQTFGSSTEQLGIEHEHRIASQALLWETPQSA